MAFVDPKIWRPNEPFSPIDFNVYVKGNMEALVDRDTAGSPIIVAGGTDITWTSTSFIILPDGTPANVTATITLPRLSVVLFSMNGTFRVSTTANRQISFDIKWVERDIFLSSMTNTPAANGLYRLRTLDLAQNLGYNFVWLQPDVPEGEHTFELWTRVNADTAGNERSDAPFSFLAQAI